MKRITLKILILGIVAVMCLSLIRFNHVYGDTQFDVLICVEQTIKGDILDSLNQYKDDLEQEGWTLPAGFFEVNLTIYNNASVLRETLIDMWNTYHFQGCVFVGDIPYAIWKNGTSSYATDYYYMDLNGTWIANEDGEFYYHTGHVRPEIWVGRLMASTVEGDETQLFTEYFKKNHNNRTASQRALSVSPRALAYIDNDPAVNYTDPYNPDPVRSYSKVYVNDTVDCLQKAYADVTLVASPVLNATNTNATDYMHRLNSTDGYEWVWVLGHGKQGAHGFSYYCWNKVEQKWEWGLLPEEGEVKHSYYLYESPKAFFYIFLPCYAAVFDKQNCIANSAIFGNGTGLASVGMTTVVFEQYPSWFFEAFDLLKQHKCIGEAFKAMYNSMIDYYEEKEGWVNFVRRSMVLLGDPTICLDQPPYAPPEPEGPDSGYTRATYTYYANTTDLNGDQVWYQFDWCDGTNATVGRYGSGEEGNASHIWYSAGTYNVTVRAKDDPYGLWSDWSPPLEVTITQHTGGCPTLFVWNGTDYADEGILNIHAESDVTVQHEIHNTLALENGFYKLQLRELDNFTSHIDQVKLYAVDYEGEWHLCPLIYAYHSELGKVTLKLLFDDDNRVDLKPTEIIKLKFVQSIPYSKVAYFIFEINGYNSKPNPW